jgi:Ca2+-binding RTX toxin-like protein
VPSIPEEGAFDFSSSSVSLQPGFIQPFINGDRPSWNTPYLSGTNENIYSPSLATLGLLDSDEEKDTGGISLGEGGRLSLHLKYAVSTDGMYLYIGDRGSEDVFSITVSGEVPSPETGPAGLYLVGTPNNDVIRLGEGSNKHLGAGNDTINGVAGNDTIDGMIGDDWLYGGSGNDKVYGSAGNDRVYGSSGHDTVDGGVGNDWIYGDSGNDRLYGRSGDDVINGGSGNDRLNGSTGRDAFVFNSKLGTASTDRKVSFDTISDFSIKFDSFWLDNSVFRKLGSGTASNPKLLNKEFFIIGANAKERDDYLIYNNKSGVLSYDADGSGAKRAVEFAQLKKGLLLTFKDFFVI